jgi:hypothetical protein
MPNPLPSVKDWKAFTLNVRRNLQPQLLNGLTEIDTDLDLYNQAFSMMAKRNLAVDLHLKAMALRNVWPTIRVGEKAPDVLVRLIDQAREAVEATGGTTKRQYDSVVCIGYEIKLSSFVQSSGVWVVNYAGDVDNRVDMMTRCGKMKTAIAEAYNEYQAKYPPPPLGGLHPPDRTLRIFMAPEFYFRGRSGAYSAKVAFEVLSLLRQETNKPKYKNWLFVLGTVIMATFIEETVCPGCGAALKMNWTNRIANYTTTLDPLTGRSTLKCSTCNVVGKKQKVGAMIDNLALIQKGGETGDANSYTVSKEYVSHVDFKRTVVQTSAGPKLPDWNRNSQNRTITVMGQGTHALAPEGSRDLSDRPVGSKFLDERMGSGGSVFEIDGIRFGLEVCLDHAKNRLTGNERVSIQLVPSCGMSWQAYKCLPGGTYFGVDANKPMCQVGRNGVAGAINSTARVCSAGGRLVLFDPLPIV